MSFSVGSVVSDTIDRIATQAGALLIGAITLLGVVQTAAWQDIIAGILERVQEEITDPERQAGWTSESVERANEMDARIDEYIADLPLALGIGAIPATILMLVASIVLVVMFVVVLDTLGHGRETLSELETDGIGWKTLNYIVGAIVASIIVFVGLLLFLIPGLILLLLLFFFPAAIVMDDKNAFGAFSASMDVVKSNVLGSIGIILLSILVLILTNVVFSMFTGPLPEVATIVLDELLYAVGLTFSLGLMVVAYANSTQEQSGDGQPAGQGPAGQPPVENAPGQQAEQPPQNQQGGQPSDPQTEQPPQDQQGEQHSDPQTEQPPDNRPQGDDSG